MAAWTVESIGRLGPDHAVPAACRGSGGPTALEWLSEHLLSDTVEGASFLDVGAGLGGPGAWLARERDVEPVPVEQMGQAARAARRLFELPVIAGSGQQLPFTSGSFDGAWSLGVLSTTHDKVALLAEMRRVLRPTGRAGAVVYVAAHEQLSDEPEGNSFATFERVRAMLASSGFALVGSIRLSELPEPAERWVRLAEAVDADLQEHHREDPRFAAAREGEQRVEDLLSDGRVFGVALRLSCSPV